MAVKPEKADVVTTTVTTGGLSITTTRAVRNERTDREHDRIREEVANEIAAWIRQGVVDDFYGGDALKEHLARQIEQRYRARPGADQ